MISDLNMSCQDYHVRALTKQLKPPFFVVVVVEAALSGLILLFVCAFELLPILEKRSYIHKATKYFETLNLFGGGVS